MNFNHKTRQPTTDLNILQQRPYKTEGPNTSQLLGRSPKDEVMTPRQHLVLSSKEMLMIYNEFVKMPHYIPVERGQYMITYKTGTATAMMKTKYMGPSRLRGAMYMVLINEGLLETLIASATEDLSIALMR